MELFEKAKEYCISSKIADVFASADCVVCAYSGGADSSVLLRFLADYFKNTHTEVCAAHLNHMIRGDDADADEEFCRKTCENLGIKLYVSRVNVPKEAEISGESLEEAARRLRYGFLFDVARKTGKNTPVVTAHNSTDNMETVIFNLTRGTGTKGLSGIVPVREGDDGVKTVRPLLFATSDEIRRFASEKKIAFVTDKTNFNKDYTRNLIRSDVLPTLRKINPRAEDAFLRLSALAKSDDRYITDCALKIAGGKTAVYRKDLDNLPDAVVSRIILEICKNASGRENISSKNICNTVSFLKSGKTGKISVHGAEIFADCDMVFAKKIGEKSTPVPDSVSLSPGKFVNFGDYLVGIFEKNGKICEINENIYKLYIDSRVNCDIIKSNLFVRCKKEGDVYVLRGVRRKLKKLMCDEKIPNRMRQTLPLICNDGGVLFVPGISPSDSASPCRNGQKENARILIYKKPCAFD